jgi:hypothetical protein
LVCAAIACQAVVGVVAGAPNLVEEVADLARDDALVLQAAQQVGLLLVWRGEQSDVGSDQLGQQLGQLPQLQPAGVGVFREVALRQLPPAEAAARRGRADA